MSKITRRNFIIGSAATLMLSACEKSKPPFGSQWHGPNQRLGHALRDGSLPQPTENKTLNTLIIGGGVAGLSCAWWLKRNQFSEFTLVELDEQLGGNARAGQNAIGAFPWGAHYLPLPGVDAVYVRELLKELGVFKGDIENPEPDYDERFLVQAPDERLFIHGNWQEGLVPKVGIGFTAQQEILRFEQLMQTWSERKGIDQKPAFTIPSALSSKDPQFLALDTITFAEWLNQQGFQSAPLNWYVSYSLRDDFGMDQSHISAWAGLHYFCCRHGRAKSAEPQTVITSPSGNGWIVDRLKNYLAGHYQTNVAAMEIVQDKQQWVVDLFHADQQKTIRYTCKKLVWAAPLFLLPRVWRQGPQIISPDYAPWLVANLSIRSPDQQEYNTWDNVIYQGKGLGYVDASHQLLAFRKKQRVLTYYHALNAADTLSARQQLLAAKTSQWESQILADLLPAHPQLESQIQSIDFWRWPHAMSYPEKGFLTRIAQYQRLAGEGLLLAHSDLSGFSLFEEAQYWGVEAAKRLLGG